MGRYARACLKQTKTMPVVAITGNFASGKSSVLRLLQLKGAVVFSADNKIHELYRDKKGSIYKKIAKAFPQVLVGQGKYISRRKLGSLIFPDAAKRRKLERIAHPAVIKGLRKWVALAKGKDAVYAAEVPLLFEKKLQGYFDYIILVAASQDVVLKRIRQKYGLSQAEALKRLRIFLPVQQKKKMADFIIDNSSNMYRLQKEVGLLWKKLKQRQRLITTK